MELKVQHRWWSRNFNGGGGVETSCIGRVEIPKVAVELTFQQHSGMSSVMHGMVKLTFNWKSRKSSSIVMQSWGFNYMQWHNDVMPKSILPNSGQPRPFLAANGTKNARNKQCKKDKRKEIKARKTARKRGGKTSRKTARKIARKTARKKSSEDTKRNQLTQNQRRQEDQQERQQQRRLEEQQN